MDGYIIFMRRLKEEGYRLLVVSLSFAICVFILTDGFLLPSINNNETVKSFDAYSNVRLTRVGRGSTSFVIRTNKSMYIVPRNLYDFLVVGDVVVIGKTKLIHSAQTITVGRRNVFYTYRIGFLRGEYGSFFTLVTATAIWLFLLLEEKIQTEYTKNSILGLLIVLPYALLLFHTGVNIFV